MSSFDEFSPMTYQPEEFLYSPAFTKSQVAPTVSRKRVRVIFGGTASKLLEKRPGTSKQTPTLQKEFQRLCLAWKKETESTSSLTESAIHPAYQRMIGLGPAAVPLIIGELAREPDWWFWALRAITGVDPVLEEDRGRLSAMSDAWLRWWESEGAAGRWTV